MAARSAFKALSEPPNRTAMFFQGLNTEDVINTGKSAERMIRPDFRTDIPQTDFSAQVTDATRAAHERKMGGNIRQIAGRTVSWNQQAWLQAGIGGQAKGPIGRCFRSREIGSVQIDLDGIVVKVHHETDRIRDIEGQPHIQQSTKINGLHQGFPSQRGIAKYMEQICLHFTFSPLTDSHKAGFPALCVFIHLTLHQDWRIGASISVVPLCLKANLKDEPLSIPLLGDGPHFGLTGRGLHLDLNGVGSLVHFFNLGTIGMSIEDQCLRGSWPG